MAIPAKLKFRFEERGGAFDATSELQREKRENMRHGRFQFRNQSLRASAEEGVKDHRRDTDGQSGSGIEKCFTDAVRKLHVTLTADVSTQGSKRANNSDHGSKQAQQWCNHTDIGEVGDAIIQIGSDPGSFGLRNFTDLLKISVRILGGEVEDLLYDPSNGFAVAIRHCEKAKVIAFS